MTRRNSLRSQETKLGDEPPFLLTEDQLEAMENLKGDNEKVNFLIDIVSQIQTETIPNRLDKYKQEISSKLKVNDAKAKQKMKQGLDKI